MKRRYLILAISFVAFVGIVLGVLAMLPPRSGVTKANFDRIKVSMTRAATWEIMGSAPIPAPNSSRDVEYVMHENKLVSTVIDEWRNADGSSAEVQFINDFVHDKSWRGASETIVDKIRRWLHLD